VRVGAMAQIDRQIWTAKQDAEMLSLASNGWTPEQVAKRMRRTPESIAGRAKKLRIDWTYQLQNSWRSGARPTGTKNDGR